MKKEKYHLLLYIIFSSIVSLVTFWIVDIYKAEAINFIEVVLYTSIFIAFTLIIYFNSNKNSNYTFILFIIVAIGIFLIIFYNNPMDNYMFASGDEYYYRDLSKYLREHGRLPTISEVDLTSYLYIVIINIILYIFKSDIYIKIFNIIYYFVGLVYVYKIIKNFFTRNICIKIISISIISPLGFWFANSYYKDSFLFLLTVICIYNCIKFRWINAIIFMVLAVLNRPGYIFPLLIIIILSIYERKNINLFKVKGKILIYIGTVFVALYSINSDKIDWYLKRLSIAKGRIADFFGFLPLNALLLPILTFVSYTQPMFNYVIDKDNPYLLLDKVGNYEAIISLAFLPFIIYILLMYKELNNKEKMFIHISGVFYLMFALIGYIFTFRHLTYSRFLFYSLGVLGLDKYKKNKENIYKGLVLILAILYFVSFIFLRAFVFSRGHY